ERQQIRSRATHAEYPRLRYPYFFQPIRRQPASTLFPYTTLFRSRRSRRCRPKTRSRRRRRTSTRRSRRRRSRSTSGPRGSTPEVDRKSTRLNSSHVAISYAVFCLKKKDDDGGLCHAVGLWRQHAL